MKIPSKAMTRLAVILNLLVATTVHANDGIPESYFTDSQGINAAQAGAPMWHMASGSCLPSAAEDGQGHQTSGVDASLLDCIITSNLAKGCPGDSTYRGANVWYHNVPGEPFADIPTYFAAKKCADNDWRVYYGVYFKKDVGHKHDWEWAAIRWRPNGPGGTWIRDNIVLEVDGGRGGGRYADVPNTFDSEVDQLTNGNRGRNHPKLYFGKHQHAVHWDKSDNSKNVCSVNGDDFRGDDFQFWAHYDLRHVDYVDPSWNFGVATNPHVTVGNTDFCE